MARKTEGDLGRSALVPVVDGVVRNNLELVTASAVVEKLLADNPALFKYKRLLLDIANNVLGFS